ncbi:hypothetical protein [Pseudomonas sp. 24 E 1]|nr:hypothetical protein [Pseudomonas sp. 52 E 6]CRM51816.1 hypothetical protein [Pseudomonas sp. 24 E 1]CRM62136.1 hypothetical protein [Pseudomonas sp. 24 R 17]CRM67812.1 hypothetical protein [Pseudomonas sp. 35 E 8]
MIRIDAIWLSTEPMDMRAGTDTALATQYCKNGGDHRFYCLSFTAARAAFGSTSC